MNQINVLTASVPDRQIPQFISQKLQPLLPYSLSLCRRSQFHLKTTSTRGRQQSNLGQPELWIAVARSNLHATHDNFETAVDPLIQTKPGWLSAWLNQTHVPNSDTDPSAEEWLAAHVDLSSPGSTQVWAFGSWEMFSAEESSKAPLRSEAKTPARTALFKALFAYLRACQIPALPTDPPLGWRTLLSSGKVVSTPYNRSKVLFGDLAECLWPYLDDDVVYADQEPNSPQGGSAQPRCIARQDQPYLKYIIDLSLPEAAFRQSIAPPGFHFAGLTDAQLQLILDRSVIPRTLELLQSLVSIGLFADGVSDPVAWGVLSKDATIASLHTEPGYRGRGLAECVAKELIRVTGSTFHSRYLQEEETNELDFSIPYAHGDVAPTNLASRRVFEKMGGEVRWTVAWIEVIVGEGDI